MINNILSISFRSIDLTPTELSNFVNDRSRDGNVFTAKTHTKTLNKKIYNG